MFQKDSDFSSAPFAKSVGETAAATRIRTRNFFLSILSSFRTKVLPAPGRRQTSSFDGAQRQPLHDEALDHQHNDRGRKDGKKEPGGHVPELDPHHVLR